MLFAATSDVRAAVANNIEAFTKRPAYELHASPSWNKLAFISDLHLEADGNTSSSATLQAWLKFAASRPAFDALFILGDFWEVWVGDDTVTPISQQVEQSLRALSDQIPVFLIHGNRDFLLGKPFCLRTGLQLLPDPTVLTFQGQRTLLSHGDALCTEDAAYMQFRSMVREPAWQRQFLAKPLAERQQVARLIRTESTAKQARQAYEHQQSAQSSRSIHSDSKNSPTDDQAPWADVNQDIVRETLAINHCTRMVHGHTHQGRSYWVNDNSECSSLVPNRATQDAEQGLRNQAPQRHVLSDWHVHELRSKISGSRAEVLFLTAAGVQRHSLLD